METQSAELIQNWHKKHKNKVLNNKLHRYILMNNRLYSDQFTFKNYTYIKNILHICWTTDGETSSLYCYSKKVRITPEEEINLKKSICIFT